MSPLIRAAALFLTLPVALAAGELEPGDEEILLDEWREMTEGRTVHYVIDGRLWGREHFHRGRFSATFVSASGECVTAPWTYAAGVYCFAYTGLDCFRHVRRGDALLAIPLSDGQAQLIERITDEPLSCEPPLSS